MRGVKRFDRVEAHITDERVRAWLLKQMSVVEMVRSSSGTNGLVGLEKLNGWTFARIVGDDLPVMREYTTLSCEWHEEPAGAFVRWYICGDVLVAKTAWLWHQSGWCDRRLVGPHTYGWPGLVDQVAFEEGVVWTCVNWKDAYDRPLLVEATDRMGFVSASMSMMAFNGVAWERRFTTGLTTYTMPPARGSLEGARVDFAPAIRQHCPEVTQRLAQSFEYPHVSPPCLNRAQRAITIWEKPHVLYHSPTYDVPLERIGFDEFASLALGWWRDGGAKEYYKER
jgi:hypothetical protein